MNRVLVSQAIRSLLDTRMRSLLAVLGIAIGSAAVISLMNIGHNTRQNTLRQFESLGYLVTMMEAHQSDQPRLYQTLTHLNARLSKTYPDIESIDVLGTRYITLRSQGVSLENPIHGINVNAQKLLGLQIAQGKALSDFQNKGPYVLLGDRVANEFAADGAHIHIGSQISIGQSVAIVAGILAPHGDTPFITDGIDRSIFVLARNFIDLNLFAEKYTVLIARSPHSHHQQIETLFSEYYRSNLPDTDFYSTSPESLIETASEQNTTYTILIGLLGLISLVVGGIGIMNIMLVAVSERKTEIGIRLAIGARAKDIRRQFLIEALLLCSFGGCIGLLMGIGVTYGYVSIFDWPFEFSAWSVVIGLGVSVITGIFFGYYPASSASKLDPITALYPV